MVATIFFLVISATIIFGLVGPIVRQQKMASQLLLSRQSYFLAEAGIEDVVYRLAAAMPVDVTEILSLSGSSATTVSSGPLDAKVVVSTAEVNESVRKVRAQLALGTGVIFKYGTQAGQGGFIFQNNSHVSGNLYSNGNIVGSNNAYITGDAYVAGSTGSISNMRVGYGGVGNAHANTVTGSTVTGTLYCQTGTGNNKSCNTSLPNPEPEPLPIADETINEWKSDAATGGTTVGNVTISTPTTLGPRKISGNLIVDDVLTIEDTIYVTGNVTISGTVALSASYGATSGIIVADGYIIVGNGVEFEDSGTEGSYILLLSTSSCDDSVAVGPCFGRNAIDVSNNSSISIVNAQNGTVYFSNNAGVKEAVGNKIELKNNVGVSYGSGLINVGFSSGPGAGYRVDYWREIE